MNRSTCTNTIARIARLLAMSISICRPVLVGRSENSAVSVASNIVEGCGRNSLADYLRFLDIAYGSVRELEYQISLATRLGFIKPANAKEMETQSIETAKVLNGLIQALRREA
ncbi:MAG TPA: four helix bundle protein [Planctomycetaceae bacterium]|nr:four helix bundle protein [Planctomycetaceae bacterium]